MFDVGRLGSSLVALTMVVVVAEPAFAVDGVVDINQTRAVAGGVTFGDSAGFPVTISASGSYRLTGNVGTSGSNVTIVDITASDVSLDLNGFAISCESRVGACNGTGNGIQASGNNIRVHNGIVRGMGNDGVTVGGFSTIENVHALNNHGRGLSAGAGSIVRDSLAVENTGFGIVVGTNSTVRDCLSRGSTGVGIQTGVGSTISGNTAAEGSAAGIYCNGGCTIIGNTVFSNSGAGVSSLGGNTVIGNTIRNNTGFGLSVVGTDTLYTQNTLTGNNGGGNNAQVSGGTSGSNFCGTDTTCP